MDKKLTTAIATEMLNRIPGGQNRAQIAAKAILYADIDLSC